MRLAALEPWLAARRRHVLAAVAVVALVARVVYWAQFVGSAPESLHRWSETDMNFFDRWARQLAGGDWLQRRPLHPMHAWHVSIARAWLREHPAAAGGAEGDSAVAAIWDRWYGGARYHQEPAYTYAVALTYALFGADVRAVYAWQCLLGILTLLLLHEVTRRHFGATAAAAAGAMGALCGPLLLDDLVLLRTTSIGFAIGGLLWLADWAHESTSWRRFAAMGAALATSVLLLATLAMFAVWFFAASIVRHRRERRVLARLTGAAAAGFAVVMLPLIARNVVVGAPALGVSSTAALSFVMGNHREARPDRGPDLGGQAYRAIGEGDGSFARTVAATMRMHDGVGSAALLEWRRVSALWHWYEVPNNNNFYLVGAYAPILGLLPLSFVVLGPLGAAGAVLAWRGLARHHWLYGMTAATLAPILCFYMMGRFRANLVVAMLPFAAFAVAETLRWASERRWRRTGVLAACVLAGAGVCARPLGSDPVRVSDHVALYRAYYHQEADRARERGDWARVEALMREFLATAPERIAKLDRSDKIGPGDTGKVRVYAAAHSDRAAALIRLGRAAEAGRDSDRARRLRSIADAAAGP